MRRQPKLHDPERARQPLRLHDFLTANPFAALERPSDPQEVNGPPSQEAPEKTPDNSPWLKMPTRPETKKSSRTSTVSSSSELDAPGQRDLCQTESCSCQGHPRPSSRIQGFEKRARDKGTGGMPQPSQLPPAEQPTARTTPSAPEPQAGRQPRPAQPNQHAQGRPGSFSDLTCGACEPDPDEEELAPRRRAVTCAGSCGCCDTPTFGRRPVAPPSPRDPLDSYRPTAPVTEMRTL